MAKRVQAKYPLAIRWFHWINFPVLGMMIWSGLLIYWANDIYTITIGHRQLFHFFPDRFYTGFFTDDKYEHKWYANLLTFEHKLSEGMGYHFLFAWFFIINGLFYVTYTALSGEWRAIVPNKQSFGEAIQVVLHDIGLSKKHPPVRKFNGAQKIAYTSIIIMGVLATLTGLAIYKPAQLGWLAQLLGGYVPARFLHFWLMIGFVAFFFVHIAQVARAGWNNFRAMITGYEIVKVDDPILQKPDTTVPPAPDNSEVMAPEVVEKPSQDFSPEPLVVPPPVTAPNTPIVIKPDTQPEPA